MRSPASGHGHGQSAGHRLAFGLTAAVATGLLAGGLLAPGVAFASNSESWTGGGDGHSWTDSNNWSGGVPQDGDSVTIAPTMSESAPQVTNMPGGISLKTLTMTDASLSGGAVTVNGDFSWSVAQGQNTLDAPLTVEGSATVSGAGKKITFAEMTFDGNTEVSGTGLLETEFSGAAIRNAGRFELEPGSSVEANACCADPNKFISTGILAVPASVGGTATLGFMGLRIGGAVMVGKGSTLDVGKSVTATISGTGTKDSFSPNGKPITLTLRGTTTVSGTGPVHIGSATTLDNEGELTAKPGTTFEAGLCCANPDRFINGGTLTVAAGRRSTTVAYLAFLNHGTVKVTSGKLVVDVLSYTQKSGVTNLTGGSLSSPLPVLIKGGTLTGRGTVGAAVVNGGTVKPSTTGGVLTVKGSYRQTKSGTFATVLTGTSPGRKFGQLVVTGAAMLAGTIKVTISHFTPRKGQSFQVMRYRSHTGSFIRKSGRPNYSVSYSGSVRIKY